MRVRRLVLTAILCIASAGAAVRAQREAPRLGPQVAPLHFHYMGPPSAGRIASVAGVPGDTSTYYLGAASGGVWKTTDGGKTFVPIFDDQPVQAIGALAVAPSNPDIVWAGTGEAWAIRDADVMGDGIYKSTDGGETWKTWGSPRPAASAASSSTPPIPTSSSSAPSGGRPAPQQERGVFKTTDGGKTWKRSLFVNPDTGCSGLAMDANDPEHAHRRHLAGRDAHLGHVQRRPRAAASTSPTTAAPPGSISRTASPSRRWQDRRRHGALGLQARCTRSSRPPTRARSGARTTAAPVAVCELGPDPDRPGGYYIRLAVNPAEPDEVLVANSSFHRSTDGGLTFPISRAGLRRLPRHLDGSREPGSLGGDR